MALSAPPPAVNHALRLLSLWIGWLLAMLFHVELGLMPLFHGLSPEIEAHVDPARLPLLFGAMLLYFALPLVAMLLIAYAASKASGPPAARLRGLHFGFSVVYTLTNIPHLIADIRVPDARTDQIALMALLVLIGLLINLEAWQWWQERRPSQP